jgi:hypothetical protein
MEKFKNNFESRESVIDKMIETLSEKEGMDVLDIISDIITFAPYEGNEDPNPDYLDEVADRLGISSEEMKEYALKKAAELFGE